VVILLLHVSQRDAAPGGTEKAAPPSPETLVELRQQQQLLAELLGAHQTREADRPRTVSPRTKSAQIMMG